MVILQIMMAVAIVKQIKDIYVKIVLFYPLNLYVTLVAGTGYWNKMKHAIWVKVTVLGVKIVKQYQDGVAIIPPPASVIYYVEMV